MMFSYFRAGPGGSGRRYKALQPVLRVHLAFPTLSLWIIMIIIITIVVTIMMILIFFSRRSGRQRGVVRSSTTRATSSSTPRAPTTTSTHWRPPSRETSPACRAWCVCAKERGKQRDRETERQRDRETEGAGERERKSEREKESLSHPLHLSRALSPLLPPPPALRSTPHPTPAGRVVCAQFMQMDHTSRSRALFSESYC